MPALDDDALYARWKSTNSPTDLQALLKNLDPLIHAEVNRRAGTISKDLLVIQAKKLTVDALRSYNPAVGVKISTHVTNQLQKLSRVNYAHQNAARIPEHSMLQFHNVGVVTEDFKANNGREPSHDELAEHLGWSTKKLEQFQTQFGRQELLESLDTPGGMFVSETHDPRINYVYSTLTPRQQSIFEMTTGYRGAKRLTNAQIMAKLGITQGVLSYEKTKLKQAVERAMS